jgi:hypothetical protein
MSEQEKTIIISDIHRFLQTTPFSYEKKMKLFCYYTKKGISKKLVCYINPRSKDIVFGISHRGTNILETYPILNIMADETKTSVIKFSIVSYEDIEKRGIQKIIECLQKYHLHS